MLCFELSLLSRVDAEHVHQDATTETPAYHRGDREHGSALSAASLTVKKTCYRCGKLEHTRVDAGPRSTAELRRPIQG